MSPLSQWQDTCLAQLAMNFNDMLKKKKKEDTENPEGINELIDENGQADGQQTAKADHAPSPVDTLKEELSLANDKYLRLYAEFDNFRRRTIKEREEARKMEGKDVIVSLLPVLDDFERALRSMGNATDVKSVKDGVTLVQHKLKSILTQKGLKEMESIGEAFDPELQEAITNPYPPHPKSGKVK